MNFDTSPVFGNSLLQDKIFLYLNTPNLAKARYVCSNWSEAGERLLSKKMRYFTLDSDPQKNRKLILQQNLNKLGWMGKNIEGLGKFYLFQKVQLPIKETLEHGEIRDFLKHHGHIITHLKLVKFDGFPQHLFGIVEECCSPLHLLHLILTSWCPNLLSLSISESEYHGNEVAFQKWGVELEPEKYFEKKLNLQVISLELRKLDVPIPYFKALFLNCPNLKRVKTKIYNFRHMYLPHYITDHGLFPQVGFRLLKLMDVSHVGETAEFLPAITPEKYPSLKTLRMEFELPKESNNLNVGILAHPGIRQVWAEANLHQFPFEVLLKMFPHATILNFKNPFTYHLFEELGENFCSISGSTYSNIKELKMETKKMGKIVTEVVVSLGQLCPNIGRLKLGVVKSKGDLSLKSLIEDILKAMRNLRYFELVVNDMNWIFEEFKRHPEFFSAKVINKRDALVYRIGPENNMRTWSRFQIDRDGGF